MKEGTKMNGGARRITIMGAVILAVMLIPHSPLLSGEEDTFFSKAHHLRTPQEKIAYCKQILEQFPDSPQVQAEARFHIGLELEKMGKPLDATSEYLKVILNYPEAEELGSQAEERLKEIHKLVSQISSQGEQLAESKTIFLAYLDSLFENFKRNGNYHKAIELLNRLIRYGEKQTKYYLELASIYLYSLNNVNLAIDYYERVIALEPDNLHAYFGLAQTYRKMGNFQKAIEYYLETIERAPNLIIAQYSRNALESIELADQHAFVTQWYLLGPFPPEGAPDFWKEETIDLSREYAGADNIPIRWTRTPEQKRDGYLDFDTTFPVNDFVVAYGLTYIYSPQKMGGIEIRLGTDSPIQVWLDNKNVFSKEEEEKGYFEFDRYRIRISLNQGWNRVLVRSTATWGSWGLFFRITDREGKPVRNLVVDPDKDIDRVRTVYRDLFWEKVGRYATYGLMYGSAVLFFLFGIGLMLVNVRNKIRISKMKSDFISNVSHQLKTPLTSIKMFTESLKMGTNLAPEKVEQYFGLILNEVDRLSHFINTVLNFSKIEKGKIYNFRASNLIEIIDNVIDEFEKETVEKGVQITFTHDSIPELLLDRDTVAEAVRNLIDNAVKYSLNEKEVTITLRLVKNYVVLEVSDKGIGIPKEEISKIFEEFYRAGNKPTGIKGTGLGLNFVKSIVEAHRGRIGVRSEAGQGTTITIRIPVPGRKRRREQK